jgi:hypothetical protein
LVQGDKLEHEAPTSRTHDIVRGGPTMHKLSLFPVCLFVVLGVAIAQETPGRDARPLPVSQAHGAELKTIAILDFDLVDDQHELSPATVEYQRLGAIRGQLQDEFAKNGLYRIVDLGSVAEVIKMHQSKSRLHECNGCELDIARALHADRVLIGWVQKVSNLILNINIQIEDAATGTVLLKKSVDLRGNTDETWRRGISFLVKSMVEKSQGNR